MSWLFGKRKQRKEEDARKRASSWIASTQKDTEARVEEDARASSIPDLEKKIAAIEQLSPEQGSEDTAYHGFVSPYRRAVLMRIILHEKKKKREGK